MSKKVLSDIISFYPVPVVMASAGDIEGEKNITTISWTGIVSSKPHMVYISVRPERHSYNLIKNSGEFVINLVTKDLAYASDFCGTNSGKNIDKFKELNLTPEKASVVKCPIIKESPINIECRVKEILEYGTHHMFVGEVVSTMVNEDYVDGKNKLDFSKDEFAIYLNREYYSASNFIGKFAYSKFD